MRISDWSSDVCSSDLLAVDPAEPGVCPRPVRLLLPIASGKDDVPWGDGIDAHACGTDQDGEFLGHMINRGLRSAIGQWRDRKSVVWGTGVSVRVDLGGSRIIKKKRIKKEHQIN